MVQYAPAQVLAAYQMSSGDTGGSTGAVAQKESGVADTGTGAQAQPIGGSEPPASTAFAVPPVVTDSITYKTNVERVYVKFQNTSAKTVDAIEFALLSFDNIGRPAINKHNDKERTNVVEPILVQGNVAPQGYVESSWYINTDRRGTKGVTVIKSVHYADGSTWVNNQFKAEINAKKEQL